MPRCFAKLRKTKGYVKLPQQGAKLGVKLGRCLHKQILTGNSSLKERRRVACDAL